MPAVGKTVAQNGDFGVVESVKTVSNLYSPLSGTVSAINPLLEKSPELVNKDPYGEGWIIKLKDFNPAEFSALLSVVYAAKPKIANYPFTTLEPNLGIVSYRDKRSFIMADIPGIIEGASEGKGLGLRFLRHIERNSLLLFMIPADTADVRNEYEILYKELMQYNPELRSKSRALAITKSDLLDEELTTALSGNLPGDIPVVFISSVTGQGIAELKDLLWNELNKETFHEPERIVHKNLDITALLPDDEDDSDIPAGEDESADTHDE